MAIGYQGKTLKQMLKEHERYYEQTGRLYVDRLALTEENPAKMAQFTAKLREACIRARESAKLIAGSPIVRTFGECVMTVNAPEGDTVTSSLGLVAQVVPIGFQIRAMIKNNYEDNPGIFPGDVFTSNDPANCIHPADVFTWVPVFYKGELVCWTLGINHITDVGAAFAPGSMPPSSVSSFTDGFITPAVKMGHNFVQDKWWELLWHQNTRTGSLNVMDSAMRVAAAKMIHDRVLEIIDEYGVDYFRQGIREILESERIWTVEAHKSLLVPGRYEEWSGIPFFEKGRWTEVYPIGDRDTYVWANLEETVDLDGVNTYDFEGLSSEGSHRGHASEAGMHLVLGNVETSYLTHTFNINGAHKYLSKFRAPQGTVFNYRDIHRSNVGAYASIALVPTSRVAFRGQFSKGYLEECLSIGVSVSVDGLEGVLKGGVPWAMSAFGEGGVVAHSGRPYMDGVEQISCMFNPESDSGENEELEAFMPPYVNIGRQIVPDSCAPGKFRGSYCHGIVQMVLDPGEEFRLCYGFNTGNNTGNGGAGLSGGYAGMSHWCIFLQGTNIRELMETERDYPHSPELIRQWIDEGRLKVNKISMHGGESPTYELKDGDIFIKLVHSEDSYGDPIERDPALVVLDLNKGWATPEAVKEQYGVVVEKADDGTWKADEAATQREREQIRERRRRRGAPAEDWWREERKKILDKDLPVMTRDALKDLLSNRPVYRQKFLDAWQLPSDFSL